MDYVMMFSTMHEVREGRARGYPAMILKNSKCNPSPDLSPQVFMRGEEDLVYMGNCILIADVWIV